MSRYTLETPLRPDCPKRQILVWFGYDTTLTAGMQSDLAKHGILVAWMAIPALLLIASAIGMKFYPLHGKQWDDDKAALQVRHSNDG